MLHLLLLALLPVVAASALPPSAVQPQQPVRNGKICSVWPLDTRRDSHTVDDVPQIVRAFEECNHGGTVVFSEGARYSIASRLNLIVSDVAIEWRGTWEFSNDLEYWRNNSYPVSFQNHRAGFILSGERIFINGHGTGGIDGNGNYWYDAEEAKTQPGRPMPFVLWNVSDVTARHFSVVQSPLWAINIMNGSNIWFDDIYVNCTAYNAPYGSNWVQNTDGFDTMDARNVALTNFVYQGGDDAIAIKSRSFNIFLQNLTVHGGNGVAIGSLGQYPGEDASVENVIVRDVRVIARNRDMHNSAYIKTWVGEIVYPSGYESDGLPNGAGVGRVTNILFENFHLEGPANGPTIKQDNGNNGSLSGTSNMLVSNVVFANFSGYLDGNNSGSNKTLHANVAVSCSTRHPCYNIDFRNISLQVTPNQPAVGATGTCKYTDTGGVHGVTGSGC